MAAPSSGIVDELCYRAAMGMFGALLGGLVSVMAALPLLYFDVVATSFSRIASAGVVAGGTVGVVTPGVLIYGTQAVLYFLAGVFSAVAGATDFEPPTTTPKWLVAAFLFGAAYVVALLLL